MIWPLFKFLGQILSNFFVGILVETMTPKGHFEINWPLTSEKNEAVFSFKYQKFSVRVNHKIKHNGTKKIILISVLYQNASTSRILGPSPLGLISSD